MSITAFSSACVLGRTVLEQFNNSKYSVWLGFFQVPHDFEKNICMIYFSY